MIVFSKPIRVTFWKLTFIRFTCMKVKLSSASNWVFEKLTNVWISIQVFYFRFPMFHSIYELPIVYIPVRISHFSIAMKVVIGIFSFINCSVRKIESALPLPDIFDPISFVSVSISIMKFAKPMFIVLFPISFVFLSCWKIKQIPSSFPKIIYKLSLIKVSIYHILFAWTVF